MQKLPPASVGQRLTEIETPALVLELDAFERNLAFMAAEAKRLGVALRPHAKAHKCGAIARRQVAAGAVGVCCQKVSEAEAMVAAGIKDLYVSNQVVSPVKLDRLAALAKDARISLAADSRICVSAAARAASDAGTTLSVFIEVDLGDRRSGIEPGPAVINLARDIAGSDRLMFGGLQAYCAEAQHKQNAEERRELTISAAALLAAIRSELIMAGIGCPVITGGGTGTYRYAGESGVYSELQPGSYIFMDSAYCALNNEGGAPFTEFKPALFVEFTVTSSTTGRAMCDAGAKAISPAGRTPRVIEMPNLDYYRADDEHGRLQWPEGSAGVGICDRIRLLPDNCDPTVNLHDWIVAVRKGQVEAVWPIDARGPGL